MHLPTFFNVILLAALTVIGGASAQDDGPGFVTKCVQPGHVALTFDDGPSPFTPKLMEYLSAAKIPATFFVLGVSINQDGGKETLKAAFDAGHQIALHSNTHADMNAKTPDEILNEYTINLKAVQDTIGVSPAMARPPFGNCNDACAKVLVGQMNLTVVQWSCDSNDWQYDTNVADQPKLFTNMQTIIDNSNPTTDSFITLQHDIKDYSVAYVPQIIDMIKGKGYTFVTVEQCTNIAAYTGGSIIQSTPAASAPANDTSYGTPSTDLSPAADVSYGTPSTDPTADVSYGTPSTDPTADVSPAADVSYGTPSTDPAADASYDTSATDATYGDAGPATDATPAADPANTAAAAYVEVPTPTSTVTSSADKFTFTFSLYLIGFIIGLLMY